MKNLLALLILFTIAIACSSGGGAGGENDKPFTTSGYVLRFKPSNVYNARDTDRIVIIEVETKTVLWDNTLDKEPLIQIKLSKPNNLLVRVTREGGVKYVSTYVSKYQIVEALRGVLNIGDINAMTTMYVEQDRNPVQDLQGVKYFTDLNFNNVNSDMVTKSNTFYTEYADRINALSLYNQLLRAEENIDPVLYNALYDAIVASKDIEGWRSKAMAISLPDSQHEGINLIANLLSSNKFLRSKTHDLLEPEELRSVFWKTTSSSDNILNYIGNDITLESGKLAIADSATATNLNVSGSLIVEGNIILNGNLLEMTQNYYTLDNTISNYYTLDNTITNYYTLDNTITNVSNTFVTQLTNTFIIDDFDTITGNSIIVGNIILGGNLLEPTINNYYYTLDNTITNLDNTITNVSNTFVTNVSNTFITQLTNTFLLTDFDEISGNTMNSGNLFLTDNIYINGNALVPLVTNNYYTLDNTITNVSNTFVTQLTNTFLLTDFDEISGNLLTSANINSGNISTDTLYVGGNLYSFVDVSTYLTQLNGNITMGNVISNQITVAGAVSFDGNVSIGSNSLLAGNVIPSEHLMYDLGTSTKAWRDIYVEDLILVSDRRLKENIQDITHGVNVIMKLRPVEYDTKYTKKHNLGLIAQEVEEVLPEIVQKGEWLGVNYTELIPVLIKAVQQQQKEIEELKRKLDGR